MMGPGGRQEGKKGHTVLSLTRSFLISAHFSTNELLVLSLIKIKDKMNTGMFAWLDKSSAQNNGIVEKNKKPE